MAKKEQNHPIDSRLIFQLLQSITGQQNNNMLYDLLHLDTNEGASFAGKYNRSKNCWWPAQSVWFLNLYNAYYEDEAAMNDCDQRLPLPNDLFVLKKIAAELCEEARKSGIKKLFTSKTIAHYLTFESHLFNVLTEQINLRFTDDAAKKERIKKVCKDVGIPQYEINRISETESVEEILVHLIVRAKAAENTPLTLTQADVYDAANGWRILSAKELKMDPMEISRQIMENDRNLYAGIPASCAGTQEQWSGVFSAFPTFCRFLVNECGEIQGNYSIVGLSEEQERLIRQGRLADAQMEASLCDPLHTRGMHAIYLLNLSVNEGVDDKLYDALWSSLIAMIKNCAQNGVYFSRIYYKAFRKDHESLVISRGFGFHCRDAEYGAVFVHEMDSETTLRILDEELATLYRQWNEDVRRGTAGTVSGNRLEAEAGFLSLFREIDTLFLNPRFCLLKPYFFENLNIPEEESLEKLGVATAELFRDILQYCASLLPYLDERHKRTYEEYTRTLMNSDLVKASQEQYQFTTEKKENQIRHVGYSQVSVKDIVNFAKIWIGIDKLFMREDLLELRPYFYEQSDCLPMEEEMKAATALAVRILSGMKIAESLLDRIPYPFVASYLDYKNMMKKVRIIQETVTKNPFLKEELNW